MDNENVIGIRISEALERENKMQKDLAAALGVKDNIISYFCSGVRKPNVSQLRDIALFLNVTSDYLLGLNDCSSVDASVQTACKVTGLSEDAVLNLQGMTSEWEEDISGCKTDLSSYREIALAFEDSTDPEEYKDKLQSLLAHDKLKFWALNSLLSDVGLDLIINRLAMAKYDAENLSRFRSDLLPESVSPEMRKLSSDHYESFRLNRYEAAELFHNILSELLKPKTVYEDYNTICFSGPRPSVPLDE